MEESGSWSDVFESDTETDPTSEDSASSEEMVGRGLVDKCSRWSHDGPSESASTVASFQVWLQMRAVGLTVACST